jgi:hypothetical protein
LSRTRPWVRIRRVMEAIRQWFKPAWLRREALLLLTLGGFGLLLLPALVYLVGERLLGEYRPHGAMGSFYADLYGHLASPSIWAWLLVLGPWLAVQFLRLLWLPVRPLMRAARRGPDGEAEA